jgi:hypothetical protein
LGFAKPANRNIQLRKNHRPELLVEDGRQKQFRGKEPRDALHPESVIADEEAVRALTGCRLLRALARKMRIDVIGAYRNTPVWPSE